MELHTRKPLRLAEFDYGSNGAYFVTVCTAIREPLFGGICRGDPCGRPPIPAYVKHNLLGQIACSTFSYLKDLYPVSIPTYMVMPDHIHMIIVIHPAPHLSSHKQRATARVAPTLGQIIGGYKSKVYAQWLAICKERHQIAGRLWQRGYYEHIIRNQQDFETIFHYIENNPARWAEKYPYLTE